jgi:hypothetical protein
MESPMNLDYSEILTEVAVDHYSFKATWCPLRKDACILWFRDRLVSPTFEALGQFSRFDKRNLLIFIARYATSDALRREIDHRRFERKIAGLPPAFFREIEHLSRHDKARAFRHLFDLDSQIDPGLLDRRRRIMARKFHPDAGGDGAAMALINQAYEFLTETPA